MCFHVIHREHTDENLAFFDNLCYLFDIFMLYLTSYGDDPMRETPELRRQRILEWLQAQKSLSIEDLVSRLDVSAMTVHRDLDALVKEGLVHKSYGHASLIERKLESGSSPAICALCRVEVPHRTAFTIHLSDGAQLDACCPHCGLLLLRQQSRAISALMRDFIYGRMVNVLQAVYVVESRVHLCCVPTVLCFASLDDADSFTRGFGGQSMNFDQVTAYLGEQHIHANHP